MISTMKPMQKNAWQMAMVITRREVRDSFRDWRIIIPIFILTLAFPGLMNFTAGRILGFVENYGAEIIGNQLIPFLLLIVGFFPMSFSLIIALETFVGEKERRSLEPLLATPLSNTQLYMGKMMAALIPPLMASYVGMAVYLVGLWITNGWQADWELLAQIFLLTTIQGIIMVAGAVVISSQVTSVRASNLLASFIIVPMAMLIQAEAAALFWGNRSGLWWLALALLITAVILMRMGIKVFNREELMGNEIDQLRIGFMWQQFWGNFSGKLTTGTYPNPITWYKDTFRLVAPLKSGIFIQLVAFALAIGIGVWLANTYPFPAHLQEQLTIENIQENVSYLESIVGTLPSAIFWQNVRVIILQTILGIFTLGVLGTLVFMVPWVLVAMIAMQFVLAGQDGGTFILATIVPHATVELPALLIAAAAGLRWQTAVLAPPSGKTLSEAFILRSAEFWRIFIGIIVPLLILAAFVEAFITPQVVARLYG